MNLKSLLALIAGLATPESLAAVKAVLATLARMRHLQGDDGQDVTPEQLSALWDAARVEFQTLGDEARASQASITNDGQ